jgi:hypothetical protein
LDRGHDPAFWAGLLFAYYVLRPETQLRRGLFPGLI